MKDPAVQVEATGETVGEARWAALHELERRYPTVDRDQIEYVVVSEGQRGLLGVGYEPARVVAALESEPPPASDVTTEAAALDESDAAATVRAVLGRVVAALGIDGAVEVVEDPGRITATVSGTDLGLLIGRHGQTIDAVQYLANAIVYRRPGGGGDPIEVVVDAEGYRERRERALCAVADRACAEVLSDGRPVALDPMTSVERKIVHLHLKEVAGVRTGSEGLEPNRYVVVLPGDEPAEV